MLYQVLPSIAKFDAISQHTMRIDAELKKRNITTQIVAEHIGSDFTELAIKPSDVVSFDNSHVLYHLSISNHVSEQLFNSNATIDLWYHNITPAKYFENWEPFIALELRIARYQLSQMAIRARRGACASVYSENELHENGCVNTIVMPVLFDPKSKIALTSNADSARKSTSTMILSVGRFAPHKRIEKLIEAFAVYIEKVDPKAQLHLVGSQASSWYQNSLYHLINELKIKNSIIFYNHINDGELSALYARADVYLCMSEHEGFCVPLVEAMSNGLPIVSSNGGAIGETLNGAGILLDVDAPLIDYVASLDLAVNDDIVRKDLIEKSKKSANALDLNFETKRSVDWLTQTGDFKPVINGSK